MRSLILVASCLVAGCDVDVYPAATPTAPTNTPAITITNTNTNTNTVDRSDTDPVPAPTGAGTPTPTSGGLPLPTYGEGVAREYAAANPHQVLHSCQITDGEAAWAFLDGLIGVLQARDARWGYLCKDASCSKVAADIVAYKASSGDTGFWIVDVLGNHCPNAGESPTQVRWGVLPFETVRRWSARR
jgi:hypothetical protein